MVKHHERLKKAVAMKAVAVNVKLAKTIQEALKTFAKCPQKRLVAAMVALDPGQPTENEW